MKIENKTEKNLQIIVKDTLEYSKVPYNTTQKLIAMISLEAPEVVKDEKKERPPVDLVCVMDRSGSMEGDKLALVQASMSFVVEQLKKDDVLTLITFDTYVKTEFTQLKMSEKGKKEALDAILSINAGSSTNLSGGLLKGYKILSERKDAPEISSLLLFTDGLANYGLTKTHEIVNAVTKIQESMKSKVSLFTFGFGKDHDANMLKPIAEAGRGMYYFLEKEDEIPNSFADCIGGLLSTVGQNITVSIKPRGETKILQSLSKFTCKKNNGEFELSIGDLYSEEKRDLLFEIEIPKLDLPMDTQKILDVTLSYFNVLSLSMETFSFVSSVERPQDVVQLNTNYEVDKQRNRIETNTALRKAKNLSDKKLLNEARKVIQDQIEFIEKSISGKDKLCLALIDDLKNLMKELKDVKTYESYGSKWMSEMEQTTNHQRGTKSSNTSKLYETSEKVKTKQESSEYMKINLSKFKK